MRPASTFFNIQLSNSRVDVFRGFSSMYGSLTTIVLIMLWMYFCMYSILLGGEVNVLMYDKLFPEKEKAELSANADEAKN